MSYVTLSRRAQLSMIGVGIAAIAGLGYGGAMIATVHRGAPSAVPVAASAPVAVSAPVASAAPAHDADLQATVDQLQHKLDAARAELAAAASANAARTAASITLHQAEARIDTLQEARDHALKQLKDLQHQLAAAQEAASAKAQNLAQLNRSLETNRGELRQSDVQRATLQSRVRQLENDLENANTRTIQYKANLESIERRLQQLAQEHDKTLAERNQLQAQLSALQGHSAVVAPAAPGSSPTTTAAVPATPPAAAPTSPAPPPRAVADRPPDQRSENTSELERLIASTGLDIDKMLRRINSVPPGQGGPYIALNKSELAPSHTRSEELQKILRTLPLAQPLKHYQIDSPYGPRIDPINHRRGFHPGVDLGAPYKSPVYSTGPGKVIFTGVMGDYGKVVEINHGHGIITRYAHLHRILVARGQKVKVHQEIGQLGSTGRSTGPHLHYEVLVDGTTQNPEKFMQAGKNVVQASGH